MLYAILCYNDEQAVGEWSSDDDEKVMCALLEVQKPLVEAGKMGPVARLLPTTTATTLRGSADGSVVLDGPFAETKEQLLGFYVLEADGLDDVVALVKGLQKANPAKGAYEIRPLRNFFPGASIT